jgi:parallel beta-helix repeat protein
VDNGDVKEIATDVGVTNLIVSDCIFSHCGGNTSKSDWSTGFCVENGYIGNAIVSNCIFEYCWESGFHVERRMTAGSFIVSDCISNNNGQKDSYLDGYNHKTYGYNAFYGAGFHVGTNMKLDNCYAKDNYRSGFHVSAMHNTTYYRYVDNLTISYCNVENCVNGTGLELRYIDNSTINNCSIDGCIENFEYGIDLLNASDVVVSDCILRNVNRGIQLMNTDNITLLNNYISDNDGSGIYNIPSDSNITIIVNG